MLIKGKLERGDVMFSLMRCLSVPSSGKRVLGNFSSLLQAKIIQPVIKILKLDFTSRQVIVCRPVRPFIVTIFLEVENEVFSSCIVFDVFGFICFC